MPRHLTADDLAHLAAPGQRVFVAAATGEPTAILDAWRGRRCLDGVTLVGSLLPGLNHLTPEAFGETCRYRTGFLAPPLRAALGKGLVDLMPLHYSAFYRWLETAPIDLAVFQAAPPDAQGRCSLGPCADFLPALLGRADVRLVAQINPRVPPVPDGVTVAHDRLEGVHEAETPLPSFVPEGGDSPALAEAAAALIEDGATLQTGVGRLPDQVLARLATRRGLAFHGGLISPAGLALLEAGAATRIVTGIAMGPGAFYQRIAAAEAVSFRPVALTHGAAALGPIPRFVAINGALEVDLFGQANSEAVGARLLASSGGVNDFMRAASASPGGRSILTLAATGQKGAVSRIVPRIGPPGLVTVQRGDVDTVVTEHGAADLRGRSLDERAEALIGVAAPAFRPWLAEEWAKIRRGLA